MVRSDNHENSLVIPSREDAVVGGMAELIGGKLGIHARIKKHWWNPVRIVMAMVCVVMAFHWVQKSPCRDGDWQHYRQYTHLCYTDIVPLYGAEGLSSGLIPYLDPIAQDPPREAGNNVYVEYPVLIGGMMAVIGLPVYAVDQFFLQKAEPGELSGFPAVKWFYDLTAIALTFLAVITVWAIARTRMNRPWDAAMVALAPALLFTATINWDLLAVSLSSVGFYAWSRKRPAWAGALFALAAAAKLYPVFIFAAVAIVAIVHRRWGPLWRSIVAGGVTWLAVNAPVYLASPEGWRYFYRFSEERGVDWGSSWYIANFYGFDPELITTTNTIASLLCVSLVIVISGIAFIGEKPARLGQIAFLLVAAFVMTNKVWSPQFVLWLIPLAVLARPRWGLFLLWQVTEVIYFAAVYLELIGKGPEGKVFIPEQAFVGASLLRLSGLLIVCGAVIYDILRHSRDVVPRTDVSIV